MAQAIPAWFMYAAAAASAATALASAETQHNQAEAEAEVQRNAAQSAAEQASAAEDLQRRRNRSILARQRAAIAESSIGFGGSSEKLQQDSAVAAELDALNIRYEGQLRAAGFKAGAANSEAAASNALTGGYLAAGGELLGGASDAYALKARSPSSATPMTRQTKRIGTYGSYAVPGQRSA